MYFEIDLLPELFFVAYTSVGIVYRFEHIFRVLFYRGLPGVNTAVHTPKSGHTGQKGWRAALARGVGEQRLGELLAA